MNRAPDLPIGGFFWAQALQRPQSGMENVLTIVPLLTPTLGKGHKNSKILILPWP